MSAHTMRIMWRRNCAKYLFTLCTLCILVSLYIVALKHNQNVQNRFHFKRLKVKRDVHSHIHEKHRVANLTPVKEPPHADFNHMTKNLQVDARKERLYVYIVDEHHEVLPYWFAAAGKKIIPKTGNTVLHIDGHADLAPPVYVPGFPFFTWPREKELKFLMQTNDAFIQASAMAGLVNRVIWVWPSWDHKDHEARYVMSTLSLGWTTVSGSGGQKQKAFCMCMKNVTTTECRTLTSEHRNGSASSSREDAGFRVPRSKCKIKKIIIVEEIHEDTALGYFKKRDWIASNENIILDIDEDYYGCSYAITPLIDAKLGYKTIDYLNSLIKSHFCPSTFSHEKESDRFLLSLIAAKRVKSACYKDKSLRNTERCQTSMNINLRDYFGRQLDKFVANKSIQMCSLKSSDSFANSFILKLAELSITQLRALQKVGFCLNTSPKTLAVLESHQFGICIGANTPKRTAISEHTPTSSEISSRSDLLKGLLERIKHLSVDLVTISRSMRDGYTPRQFFEQIEGGILNSLNVTMGRQLSLHYDRDLLGGKPGWPARHKT